MKHAASVGEVCELVTDGTHYTPKDIGVGIPFLTVKDVSDSGLDFTNCSFIAEDAYRAAREGNSAPEKGDVLFSKDGTVGKVHVVSTNERFAVLSSLAILRPKRDRTDANYLAHALRSPSVLNDALKRKTGSAIRRIILSDLKQIRLPLPPIRDQQRIAEILDKADALRTKRRAAIAQLNTLAQSIFREMFGDPISNPNGWPTVRFEQICERVTVGIVVKPASYYVSEGVPALRSLNIKPGKIILQDLVYFSSTDNETKLTKTKLKAGDLVLVRSGRPGTAAVVPRELHGVNAIDLLIATPLPKLTDVTFLCEFFNSAGGRDLVLSRQRGQVQKHLNVSSLNEAIIPLPSIELQREFARRIRAMEKLKTLQRTSLAELDALLATLQHRAFRGEL